MGKKLTFEECKAKYEAAAQEVAKYDSQLGDLSAKRKKEVVRRNTNIKRMFNMMLQTLEPICRRDCGFYNLQLNDIFNFKEINMLCGAYGTRCVDEKETYHYIRFANECTMEDIMAGKVKCVLVKETDFSIDIAISLLDVGEETLNEV